MREFVSHKAAQFKESVIREMSRVAAKHKAVNLAQGFPDFPAPPEIKDAACRAIMNNHNQYAITWGTKSLRDGIVAKTLRDYGVQLDPETNLTVCCGATEGMIASLMATVNPGEEVVVFEPFYENYGPDAILCGATPRFVSLNPPEFSFDRAELAAAFNDKTRAIIINSPNNPTGRVFSRGDLEFIAELCQKHDVLAITDEIYEHILYDGAEHIPLWTLPGMAERTIAVNSVSKTYSVTGWRIGFIMASAELTTSIRKVHDFLTVGAAAPLQEAAVAGLEMPQSYYENLCALYTEKRDHFLAGLDRIGLKHNVPQGTYFVMIDISDFLALPQFAGWTDLQFCEWMIREVGVAAVPGSSFFREPVNHLIRMHFARGTDVLDEAVRRMEKLTALLK